MIVTSTCLMVTAGWLMPSTQAVSHGAGHSRPVNSGKLFVACSRSVASRHRLARSGRSTPGSGCRAGSRGGRTGCRSPCSAPPGAAASAGSVGLVHLVPVHEPHRHRTARRAARARRVSGTPSGQPFERLHDPRPDGLAPSGSRPSTSACRRTSSDPRVVARHDLGEALPGGVPVLQQPPRRPAEPVSSPVPRHQLPDHLGVLLVQREQARPGRCSPAPGAGRGRRRCRRTSRRRSCARCARAPPRCPRSCTRSRGRRPPRPPPRHRSCGRRSAPRPAREGRSRRRSRRSRSRCRR